MYLKMRKISLFIFILVLSTPSASMAEVNAYLQKYFSDKISLNMPSTWKLVEIKANVIPDGHYWGMEYTGERGLLFVLEGDSNVFIHWMDKHEKWHQEALAKESIKLWIMPSKYSESWKRFFIIHRPVSAELLFAGDNIKIYGSPSHHIISKKKFNEILSNAKSTKWPDSPSNTGKLSWTSWKEDIESIFEGE